MKESEEQTHLVSVPPRPGMSYPAIAINGTCVPLNSILTFNRVQSIGWTRTPEQQVKHDRRLERDKQRRKCPWYNKHR